MQRALLLLVFGIFIIGPIKGQIKIGDNPQNIEATSVLELESNSRVLVITRINTAQMNAIVPSAGAIVYNTDLQCIHYYDGAQWINVCEEVGGIPNLTTEPLINTNSTLVITPNGENNHIEVAPNSIRTEQIVDGGINGDDIQDNSIGQSKIGNDAVGRNEIAENAVGLEALDTDQITLSDFNNTPGFITGADIVSSSPGNAITDNGGAFYSDQVLQSDIAANAGNITSNTNIIQTNANEIALKEDTANKSDNTALGNSPILFPTQNAVKTYVDTQIAGSTQTVVSANTPNSITLGTDGGALFNAIPLQNGINANTTALGTKEDLANKTTDINLGNSNTQYPSQNAVKTYVDNIVGGSTQTIVSGQAGNDIVLGIPDGGAYYNDGDGDDTNELQSITLTGNNLVLSDGGGTVPLPSGADGVVTNMGTSGNNLNVTGVNGGFNGNVNLEPLVDNAVSNNGFLTSEVDGSITNEIITASTLTGNTLTITEGGNDFDIDLTGLGGGGEIPNNELITNASLVGTDLIITDPGQTWTIPLASLGGGGADGVVSNVQFQGGSDLVFTGANGGFIGTIDLSGIDTTLDETAVDGFVANNGFLTVEVDGDITNEAISNAELNGNTLEITEGGNLITADLSALAGGGAPDLASVLAIGSSAGNSQINDLLDPTLPQDAATQNYVEARIATILATGGVDGVVSNAFLTGTEIDFIGSNGGFNGTVDLNPVFATDAELTSFTPDWTSLTNRPIGLDDGDDDTTYNAGAGLTLTGTTFDVDSGTIATDWTNLTSIPVGFADDTDDDTTYTAGTGLTLTGTTFAVDGGTIAADWTNLTSIPADFADNTDDDTTYTAGAGLTLTGTTFAVDNGTIAADWTNLTSIPSGFADDTDDDTTYTAGTGLILTGTTFAVDGGTIAADWTNLTSIPAGFADDTDDDTTYTAGAGLTLTGTTFAVNGGTIAADWTNITSIPAGFADDTDDDTTYTAGTGLTLTGTTFAFDGSSITPDWNTLINVPAGFADDTDDDTTYTAGVGLTLNGTDFDVDDLAGEVTGPTSATVIANNAVTSVKINDATILAADLNDMGAANNEVLKWNGATWAPAADAGGTVYTAGVGLILNGTDFDVDDLAGEVTGPTSATVIANNAVTSAKINDATILAADLNDMGAANNEVLKWNGAAWAPAADAGGTVYTAGVGLTLNGTDFDVDDLAGEVTGPTSATVIANNAVTSAKIQDLTVTTFDIASLAVNASKIAPGTPDQILRTNPAGTAVTWVDLPAGGTTVTPGIGLTLNGTDFDVDDLVGEVTGPTSATVIANDAIVGGIGGNILDNSITAADLAPNSVDQSELQADSVGESELIAEAVTPAKIQPGASDQILRTNGAGTAITWVDLPAGGAVSSDGSTIVGDGSAIDLSVPTGGITTTQIADGTIENADIAVDAIESQNILNGEVTTGKIRPSFVNGDVLTTVGGGVAWQAPAGAGSSPVVGIAKINSGGGVARQTTGLINNVSNPAAGQYTVNLNGGFVSTSNYILQISVQGDNRIYVTAQAGGSFSIEIKTGQTNALADANWYFTILE